MRRRVVITGIGCVSGAGDDSIEFLNALRGGQHGFSAIADKRLAHLKATHVARVDSPVVSSDDPVSVRNMDRVVHLALRALREAVASAGLENKALGERTAVILGTCSGGMLSIEKHYEAMAEHRDILDASLLFSKRYYTPAKVLAWAAGASGPVRTVVTACAAGAGAIGDAALMIRHGLCDAALAGGADTFAPSTLVGFDALKATCEGICTPFSTNIGLNLGEGAAILVLEALEVAKQRGVPVLAEILGAGQSNDAYHPTSPDPSCRAQVAALERALGDAGVTSDAIDYINAHGTGTRANDAVESRTIAKVLGTRAEEVPVSSTKSLIGHCLGAAGALETAATIMASHAGFLPPTVGIDKKREGCSLDYVPELNRPYGGRIALTNSFGFGGNNACLLLDTAPHSERSETRFPVSADIRPVITGIGAVHALGVGFSPLLDSDTCGIAPLKRLDMEGAAPVGGGVPDIDVRQVDRRLDLKGLGTMARYATVSARLALQWAGVCLRPAVMAEIGTVMGLSSGDTESEAAHLTATFENDFKLDRVDAFPYVVQNAAAGQTARVLLTRGYSTVLSCGWGAGLSALNLSALAVETGQVEAVLATGCDVLTRRSYLDGVRSGCFDPSHGIVPGEGAATLLVEHPVTARNRGRIPLAEILGYAEAADIDDPMKASGEAAYAALRTAIERAGVMSDDIAAIALGLTPHSVHRFEQRAVEVLVPRAARFSLYSRLGFSEAALHMLNLATLIAESPERQIIAALSLSPEGVASATIVRSFSIK